MPQIGWFELLVIIIVAILVIGPKDFPIVLKKIGSWVGSIKRYFSDVQKNVNEITNLEEAAKWIIQYMKKEYALKMDDNDQLSYLKKEFLYGDGNDSKKIYFR